MRTVKSLMPTWFNMYAAHPANNTDAGQGSEVFLIFTKNMTEEVLLVPSCLTIVYTAHMIRLHSYQLMDVTEKV